jgi:hypothetical protein
MRFAYYEKFYGGAERQKGMKGVGTERQEGLKGVGTERQ